MSEKAKATHNAYCDYEIAKAKHPLQIYSVRTRKRKQSGIHTHNMSKAMLARQLASLFQCAEGGIAMYKTLYIIASNGAEVIDCRPEAEIADTNRQHFEERYAREQKRKLAEQLKRNKHPFAQKLLSSCGLLQKGEYI